MLLKIIRFSIRNKLLVLLFTAFIAALGIFALTQIPIGAVPDITNNQVQVLTTSQNLSTQDIEQFITYPIELEMANLPGIVEIRSISKFGLSVVTIVFEDAMGTYLPRQLIAEKIKSASEKIPAGFGSPEMGPISTGLGEIYQYILDTKPGYKERYSSMDLRTIQDWIVKRQLSGIPGVVEVNTWGGHLKQYEVAINTEKLNAMDITATEVFQALENNNSVAGGGYIEKVNQAYFIRGEGLVSSLEDLGNIVVKNRGGVSILIRDIAKVGFGSATRFGAITGNGEGEKVLGQVMMLRDANSKEVIEAVKERVASISKTLPEGVFINAFLDRSELIAKTTATVAENLILGCLIVVFVVVLLLGNLRSGLVVASVIPLCLLFALCMMYLFRVDANLMSLGAIDFGIIIDGTVIIVEHIAFRISRRSMEFSGLSVAEKQQTKDEITEKGASKMMNSAIFGQLIILIVFIPILSLTGVEGKMFRPMALTFSFALIGAMIFCFTYVPVVSSLILKPTKASDKNVSARFMAFLNRSYEPVIRWALNSKQWVMGPALALLAVSVYLFSTLGAEFVPTLDEGDFVIQPVLKTGTSLGKTIETTTAIEKILLERFPEVKHVVTRIGAAEVPTDPMSMEESDVIIILNPKDTWVTASTKDALADKFKEALQVFPGMGVEFTQPIEMRFNELITGVRADIAVKVFGEDLRVLNRLGNSIKRAIAGVEGASDVTVEKIAGLPQMNVKFNRSRIARHGLNIDELNRIITMGFSGINLGSVFEGEKRFDLTLRLDAKSREDMKDLENLLVDLPSGGKIPLSQLADIAITEGAAKISRDDTKRRIVVGINVRNRDLQSVVDDVQQRIESEIRLPVGYTITYGGQFENLKSARSRLLIAVPIALALIFILLFFAFNSVKEALMVYSAIPLAAIGGVWLLWIRGMPFSISAGIGFIALFGIAVLNGIVLIEHFKELKNQGMTTKTERIVQGSKDRLRAVLLTASAAALGFLPMAVSSSAGAEVQRPLATVVIGGLVTATLLTLVVLPVLYSIFGDREGQAKSSILGTKETSANRPWPLALLLLLSLGVSAQEKPLGLPEIMDLAGEYNTGLKAASLKMEEADALMGSAFNFDKTQIYYQYDQNNLAFNNKALDVYGIQQNFLFPTRYFAQKKILKTAVNLTADAYELKKWELNRQLSSVYYRLQYARAKQEVYRQLDSLYRKFSEAAQRRFDLGETNYLERITARAKYKEWQTLYLQVSEEVQLAEGELHAMVQADSTFLVFTPPMEKLAWQPDSLGNHPEMAYYRHRNEQLKAESSYEVQRLLPDISLNYFQGSNSDLDGKLYGYQLGLKIPLFFQGNSSRIKAARIARDAGMQETENYKRELALERERLLKQLSKYETALAYYEEDGRRLSDEIRKTAGLGYTSGEITFFEYIQSLENANEVDLSYLENLHQYNQTVIALSYLTL
jgi:cobalt-zinc-cadmium resistance protein CzcA